MSKTELIIPQNQAQQLLKFALYVAKLEEGCAPSVGFMIEVIKKAKAAVGASSLIETIDDTNESNKRSDLEALIFVNISSKWVKDNTELNPYVKKMADDIQEQFELTYKPQ